MLHLLKGSLVKLCLNIDSVVVFKPKLCVIVSQNETKHKANKEPHGYNNPKHYSPHSICGPQTTNDILTSYNRSEKARSFCVCLEPRSTETNEWMLPEGGRAIHVPALSLSILWLNTPAREHREYNQFSLEICFIFKAFVL